MVSLLETARSLFSMVPLLTLCDLPCPQNRRTKCTWAMSPMSSYFGPCSVWLTGGTAAAAPPPFRPGNPALCGSCPLVTTYYCRLGGLLCYTCMLYLSTFLCVYACVFCVFFVLCVVFLYSFLLQYFDTVGWVFWPVKTVSHITYTVLAGT